MSSTVMQWAPQQETYKEFSERRAKAEAKALLQRRQRELFRLSLSSLQLDRYVFGVEHGLKEPEGPWRVHAYVACKDCYKGRAGLVDPRTLIANSSIREELDPLNDVLSVGANMLTVIKSMMLHEQEHHGGRPA